MRLKGLRRKYHQQICAQLLSVDKAGVPNNADRYSELSVSLALGILEAMQLQPRKTSTPGQTAGRLFEMLTRDYLEAAFRMIEHLRPGKWQFTVGKRIEEFEQYEHLAKLSQSLSANKELRAALGDYLINPDIVVGRLPVRDNEINDKRTLLGDDEIATLTPLRAKNSQRSILHASISCKWTIRSDRSQNARTEGLNLVRNRKGQTPHIAIVTAEPYPQRIASVALGTGDIDCVYHFALQELQAAANSLADEAVLEMLDILVSGKRLRDISDLPFDLAT
ncbi:MAG: restriction endonuclease [Ignavibacteria bacterium]|nr:restriction endonuclease [Ignavibacteria bacterium]